MPPSPPTPERTPLKKPSLYHRQSSTLRYHTFPTAPPRNAGPPQQQQQQQQSQRQTRDAMKAMNIPEEEEPPSRSRSRHRRRSSSDSAKNKETPLPKGQLLMLAVIALAEQTALNSISPYLPEMASTFPDVETAEVGMYVGLIASAFALAQFATNFIWGWLSDRIGRKPIILCGTFLTACCFALFGLCRTLWQAILVQAAMGLVNGNAGVVSTCLGEITDRSNQSRAFTYLPVIYGLGGITGPIVGGLLVFPKNPFDPSQDNPYPYLAPNLFAAAVLIIDLILTMIFLKESLECAQDLPPIGKRIGNMFSWLWQFTSSHRPTYHRRRAKHDRKHHRYHRVSDGTDGSIDGNTSVHTDGTTDGEDDDAPALFPSNQENIRKSDVFTRDTILLLITFLISQLVNIAYNSLYPIFGQAAPPTGRDLNPEEIGISLAFAGAVTILFQVGIFGRLREKIGNKITYRVGFAGFVISFLLMPWVGYKDGADGTHEPTTMGQALLWIELAVVLVIKTVASVGGLTSALLLITNSAPSHAVLGTLNGLAQTLSAAGRAAGPFVSGSLFSAAVSVRPKGEALAFGVFGGIAFLGFLLSFGIRGAELESEDWESEGSGSGSERGSDEEEAAVETEAEASSTRRR